MSTTETVTPEVLPPEDTAMHQIVVQNNLLPDTAKNLEASFKPLFSEARAVLEQSRGITVTDVTQTLQIKLARACRLSLRSIRVKGDKARKDLKDESVRRGKAIDGCYHILADLIETEEGRLEEQEKFAERKEAERKAQLKTDREAALKPYGLDTSFMDLGSMPDDTFAQLLENSRSALERKQEEARKAEEERIRQENERLKEAARIREENARLKREADEREAAAKAEREKAAAEKAEAEAQRKAEAEAARVLHEQLLKENARRLQEREDAARKEREAIQAKADKGRKAAATKAATEKAELERKAKEEREGREKLEAEAKARREEEERAKQEAARLAHKLEMSSDSEKLIAFAANLRAVLVGSLTHDDANIVMQEAMKRRETLAAWIEREAKVL